MKILIFIVSYSIVWTFQFTDGTMIRMMLKLLQIMIGLIIFLVQLLNSSYSEALKVMSKATALFVNAAEHLLINWWYICINYGFRVSFHGQELSKNIFYLIWNWNFRKESLVRSLWVISYTSSLDWGIKIFFLKWNSTNLEILAFYFLILMLEKIF